MQVDTPIALLPVRIETRYATEATGPALLVRIYPDEIHVDDHQPELTDAEMTAATAYWTRVWRAGRADVPAERAAFVELCGRVGVTRGLWVTEATHPDESNRPDGPTPDDRALPAEPVLPDTPHADTGFARAAVSRTVPDRWTVLGYRGGAEVLRVHGNPIPDPLMVGPAPDRPRLDPEGPPLDDNSRWLVDFDAALAVGMAVRCPLPDPGTGFDRLAVVGVRAAESPEASAGRLRDLLAAKRYTSGLGFVPSGAPTNNTAAARSNWSRRPDAGSAFDAQRETSTDPAARAALAAAALGLDRAALDGLPYAAQAHDRGSRPLQVALWPVTLGYFLNVLLNPVADDATVQAVNDLYVEWVRGLGPLPSLRIGAQPYGLLPVTALGRWQPAPGDAGRDATLVDLARRLRPEWLAATGASAARHVPHVGSDASASAPDQEMLNILARDALSGRYRLRPIHGGLAARGLDPLQGRLDAAGGALAESVHHLLGGGPALSRLARFEFDPRTARIRRAVVLAGELSETEPVPPAEDTGVNYLAYLSRRGERTAPFAGPGSGTLLFALAGLACSLADAEAALRIIGPARFGSARAALEPELVDASGPDTLTAPRLLARPASDVVAELPVGQSIADFLATATAAQVAQLNLPNVTDGFRHASAVRRALSELADLPSAELDRLARAALDVCSHRLDAWLTAFATRRLADVRANHHRTGIHIGGYGWVENLRPAPDPQLVTQLPAGENGKLVTDQVGTGYVLAPSTTHASAAALLLSGHLSHRGGNGPAANAFAVDLASDRARQALWLLDGVRQGQPLGALLGYLFERGLHDRSRPGLELDGFIRPIRALAPLVAGAVQAVADSVEAVESAAASAVVDGLALLEKFHNAAVLDRALIGASTEQRAGVVAEVAALADAADALADLLLAETTYQVVAGNVARAAASLDALGNGLGQPPEPEVTQTPRGGYAHTHRLALLAPTATAAPPGWGSGAQRPRRIAEPRLDSWAAHLLGPADSIRAAVRMPGGPSRQVSIADLGRCALDLVHAGDGELERAVLDRADMSGAAVIGPDDADWPADFPADAVPLEDALVQARWLHDALSPARPLVARDLLAPGSPAVSGVRRSELAGRAQAVADRYRSAATELAQAQDEDAVRSALISLSAFGLVADDRDTALAETNRVLAELDALAGSAVPDTAEFATLPEVAIVHAILGDDFPVLPLVDSPGPAFADARAAGEQPGFLNGDAAAPLAWLHQVGRVRGPVERYLLALAGGGGRISVAQSPSTPRWVGLPLPPGSDPAPAATSILVHALADEASAGTLAGLIIDEWAEVVPARSTTAGVAFAFDEPGARAPQAVLIAVPPELGQPWTLDTLADIVTETADLARIRVVGPDEVPWLGRYLPALYVADNARGDTLTVDLHELVAPTEAQP
jgi:hypothetical protein